MFSKWNPNQGILRPGVTGVEVVARNVISLAGKVKMKI